MAGHRHRGRRDRAGAHPRRGHSAQEDQLIAPQRRHPVRRTGRRPGNPDTREAVLTAARSAFAERGFDGASIRGIAAEAGVDPALVHHYFGSKDKLFLAALQAPADPGEFLPEVLESPREELGAGIVGMLLRVWDGPVGPGALALLRSAVNNDWSLRLLREFLTTRIIRRVVNTLPVPDDEREARGALVASQLVGLVMARYVLRIEPLASATPDSLVASVGPTVQRYLTGEVSLPVVSTS